MSATAVLEIGHHGSGNGFRQLAQERGDHAIAAMTEVERRREQLAHVHAERASDSLERFGTAMPALQNVQHGAARKAGPLRQLVAGHAALGDERANRILPDGHRVAVYTTSSNEL